MSQIHITLFGGINIDHLGKEVQSRLTTTCGILLAYLIVHREQPQPRDVLASLLWEDLPTEKAHACLNTTIWRLRQILEPDRAHQASYIVSTSMGEILLNYKKDIWVDIINFEEKFHKYTCNSYTKVTQPDIDDIEETLKLYKGDFLKGCYSDWALRERERFREHYLGLLYYSMNCYEYHGLYQDAITKGKQILDIDQLHEDVHRKLMNLYIANGQRSLAIRQYHFCRDLLRTELNVEPMPETQELIEKIMSENTASTITARCDGDVQIRDALAQVQSAIEILKHTEKVLQERLSP